MERRALVKAPLFCSCRLILSVVSCLGFVCMYSLRFNMGAILPCMVDPSHEHKTSGFRVSKRPTVCMGSAFPVESNRSSTGHDQLVRVKDADVRFKWDKSDQSAVIGSFFWGYCITQMPGAMLSTRYGGKKVFGWATFASGVTSMLIPVAASLHLLALIALRFLLGLVQGLTWPSMFFIWSRWAPPLERQKLMTLCFSGTTFGIVFTFPIVDMLCDLGGQAWVFVFYIPGAVTILYCILWKFMVYDTPNQHPRISKTERTYISNSLKETMPRGEITQTPWKHIMTSPAVWAFMFSHSVATFSMYTLVSYIQVYLRDVHYFPKVQATGIVVSSHVAIYIFSNISAAAYDEATARNFCSRTFARKVGNTLGLLVPGLLLIPLAYLDCTQNYLAMSIVVTINTFTSVQIGAGFTTNPTDIDPQHAGHIYGFSNIFATAGAAVSLMITKELTAGVSIATHL
ncbi:hypothetical protein BsWGS_01761 [Bradybaena similaris]